MTDIRTLTDTEPPPPPETPTRRRRRRLPSLDALLIMVGLALIGLSFRALYPERREYPDPFGSADLGANVLALPADAIRLEPGRFDPSLSDDFDRFRAQDELTGGEGSLDWRQPAGRWSVVHDAAVHDHGDGRALAVVDAPAAAGLLQVTMVDAAPGTGLAFRFEDLRNYWMLVSSPPLETWTVIQVVDGRDIVRGDLGHLPTGAGTRISVVFAPETLRFFVNGRQGLGLLAPAPDPPTAFGLVALSESAGRGTWDDFTFSKVAA